MYIFLMYILRLGNGYRLFASFSFFSMDAKSLAIAYSKLIFVSRICFSQINFELSTEAEIRLCNTSFHEPYVSASVRKS